MMGDSTLTHVWIQKVTLNWISQVTFTHHVMLSHKYDSNTSKNNQILISYNLMMNFQKNNQIKILKLILDYQDLSCKFGH
jgi:hypothetical protein